MIYSLKNVSEPTSRPSATSSFDAATMLKNTIFIRSAVRQCCWSPGDFSKPTGLVTTITTFLGAQSFYPDWPLFAESHDDLAKLFFAEFCESFSTQVQACTPVAGIADAAGQDPSAPIPTPQPSALSLCSLVQEFKGDRQLLRGVSTTVGLASGEGGKEILRDGGIKDHLVIAKINLIIKSSLEEKFPAFSWTSLLINVNTTAEWHVDSGCEGQSALVVVGEFSGGEFVQEGGQPIVIKDAIILFDGRRKHRSLSFQGTRISVVAYSHRVVGLLSKGMSTRAARVRAPW